MAALSILVGAVGATGPGVTVKIEDPGPGVSPEVMLDVINELRAAGAEAIEINDGHQSVRVGVDTWVVGSAGLTDHRQQGAVAAVFDSGDW